MKNLLFFFLLLPFIGMSQNLTTYETELNPEGIVFPRMNTIERNNLNPSPIMGQCIYNTDNDKIECFNGGAWKSGRDGLNCWDLDGDGLADTNEDTNGDGTIDVTDCRGIDGKDGRDGLSCWDLNGNGIADANEDTNGDGVTDIIDCRLQGPIAWGTVRKNLDITGSNNFNVIYDINSEQYEITISGINYSLDKHNTQVTVMDSDPKFAVTDNINGKLLISIYDVAGNNSLEIFSFRTYKN